MRKMSGYFVPESWLFYHGFVTALTYLMGLAIIHTKRAPTFYDILVSSGLESASIVGFV